MPQYFQNYGQTQDPLELLTQSGMGIGQGLVGALGKVGSILDLPASTVRDLVAGKGAAESFDQWVDPFNEKKRVSGRDLLRQGPPHLALAAAAAVADEYGAREDAMALREIAR